MLSGPQNSASDDPLASRLAALRLRICAAAEAAGRDVRSITLLAVSKGQPPSRLRAAAALGIAEFGENYLPEALPKIRALQDLAPVWHFIGRLQANKTRSVAENFSWVHSVDRLKIAERLSLQRPHFSPPLNLCIQVNILDEATKGGITPDETLALLPFVAALPRLRLRGLMCMLPYGATLQQQGEGFGRLRELQEEARRSGLDLDTLSMGMSADLEQAIQEGSTMVRIGTALFGERA